MRLRASLRRRFQRPLKGNKTSWELFYRVWGRETLLSKHSFLGLLEGADSG